MAATGSPHELTQHRGPCPPCLVCAPACAAGETIALAIALSIGLSDNIADELPPSERLRLHAVVAVLPEHVHARGQGLLQALLGALGQIRPGRGLLLRKLEPARA